ncbi:MAG: ATP-binding protein [Sedimenticola sp.]
MSLIIVLAVLSMLSSVFIAKNSEGFAAAINQAGTLRMQSYRIASSLVHNALLASLYGGAVTEKLVAEFESRLFSPRIHNVLIKGADPSVHSAYQAVEDRWQEKMHPQLEAYLEIALSPSIGPLDREQAQEHKNFYLSSVDDFVEDIHHFVETLEIDAENNNQQLRMIQIVSLVLMLLVAAVSLYLTKKYLLNPLKDLLKCAESARGGDFSVRSGHLGEDELGQLGAAFDVMAEDLSKSYADLEARVQAKTADLKRSNQSLELLYNISKRLSSDTPNVTVLEALIHDVEKIVGIKGGSICLGAPGDTRAYRLASTHPLEDTGVPVKGLDCSACIGNGESHRMEVVTGDNRPVQLFTTPIKDQDQQYGVLVVELCEDCKGLEEWQQRLLESISSQIAIAINMSEKASQHRMLSLLEERSVIARELHDSLAQSLSYLKIQVSRLDKSIREGEDIEGTLSINEGLRKGLNGAYRQLRELLATFRLRISESGLNAAIEDTVKEYRERSGIEIELHNRMANCKFSSNAEIHVMQIIREALSNVTRHANASHAKVDLDCDMDGQVSVRVEDNGIGIDDERDMMLHYGLPIMKERAEWLGGSLEIGESPEGGTSVKLTFTISDSEQTQTSEKLIRRMQHA